MSIMMSSLSSSYAYGNPVYLTNLVVSAAGYQPMTASFDLAGGTNFVPYDILMTTNLLNQVADWNWLGIGYTSNHYTFNGQPASQAFYRLAKPAKTMVAPWGDNIYGQCDILIGITNAVQVTGGIEFSLALLNNGMVVGWGYNGASSSDLVPTNLAGVTMIASGWKHNVALLTNSTLTVWGDNFWNQLNIPAGLSNVTVVSAQALHSLALRKDGTVVAWGYNSGLGETIVPTGLSNVVAIAAGGEHNLAVSNGLVVAWGYNGSGQCTVPAGLSNVWDVAAGWEHSVALKKDGTVVCWGDNSHGESIVPAGLSNVVAIFAGGNPDIDTAYSLALKGDGTFVAWGDSDVLNPVGGLNDIVAIGGGTDHALAIRTGPPTPAITLEPGNQYQVQGGNVTFNARGAGLYGVTYQWQTNSVNLSGATNAALTFTNVQPPAQFASYRVVVGNEAGSIASTNASFYFVTPPVINSLTVPTNQTVIYQSNLVLNISAWAPGMTNGFPLSYQWQFNGTNIGANAAAYTIHANASSGGTYSVLVSNAAGSTNAAWSVTVYSPTLLITRQPTNQYQIAGGTVTFVGTGISSNAVTYQWALNSTNILGATNAVLTLTNVSAAQQGYYNFTVNDGFGSLTSSNANFYLVTPPTITLQTSPTNLTVVFQTNVTLNVTASAPGQTNGFPLSYHWQFNGTNIAVASTASYTFNAGTDSSGNYSVIVTNAAGSTSAVWQVTMTYLGSYIDVGTLAYHLSTNAVGRTNGFSDIPNATTVLSGWTPDTYSGANLEHLTNSVWSTSFWLKGVQGLSATCIGYSNGYAGKYLITMVSPRHYLDAYHVALGQGTMIAFLDTNNVIYWRTILQKVDIGTNGLDISSKDTSVGILNADLPSSVGFLPVVPTNISSYLPTNSVSIVQGIGMNQDMRLFGQPMKPVNPNVIWGSANTAPFGLGTNWNVSIRNGDSSDPEMLLVGSQLVLISHNHTPTDGPNYALLFDTINQQMHYLSTNNSAGTDYQLTPFSLTNWPTLH